MDGDPTVLEEEPQARSVAGEDTRTDSEGSSDTVPMKTKGSSKVAGWESSGDGSGTGVDAGGHHGEVLATAATATTAAELSSSSASGVGRLYKRTHMSCNATADGAWFEQAFGPTAEYYTTSHETSQTTENV